MADTQRSAYERVQLARSKDRPNIQDYIDHLFTDFFEQRGDRASMDDGSIVGGIAMLGDRPVTVIGHRKGKTLEENVRCNFGMPQPEGYRKAMRLMRQAEKFGRPVITFVDTPGAYPGLEAEQPRTGRGHCPEHHAHEQPDCAGDHSGHRRGQQRRRAGDLGCQQPLDAGKRRIQRALA